MTRKDYEAIAAAFRYARSDILTKEPDASHADMLDGAALAAEHIATTMAADNPAFDRARFLKACGVQS
jgi:hypothetical protein